MKFLPPVKKTIHYLITLFFLFGFQFLPAPEPITRFGMGVLGVFIGAVYGWSLLEILWPSILGLAALSLVVGGESMYYAAFGNHVVPMMIVLFIFLGMLDYYGVTTLIAKAMVYNRLTKGRPLVLIFLLLLGAYVLAPINAFVGILLFMAFSKELMKACDIEMPSKLSMLIAPGLALSTMLGQIAIPFLSTGIVLDNALRAMTGIELPYVTYMKFMIPMDIFLMVVYVLMIKYVFRADVSKLTISEETLAKEKQTVNGNQKVALVLTAIFLVLAIMMVVLPKTMALSSVLNKFGLFGIITCLICAAMLFTRDDGHLYFNFRELSREAISWDVIFLSALIMAISTYMSSSDTGINAFLGKLLAPLTQYSPLVFILLIIIVSAIITNFMNNTVICVIAIPIVMGFASQMDINSIGTLLLLFLTAQFAMITPGASPFAAIAFGQEEMVRAKDLMKYAVVAFVILLTVTLLVGLLFVNLIFA